MILADVSLLYAYSASATTDYLNLTVLVLYVLTASPYLLYTVMSGRTPNAWEKLEDLIALAHTSRSASQILANTCAGIERAATRALDVRLLVLRRGKTELVDEEWEEVEQFTGSEEEVQMGFDEIEGGKGMVYDFVQVDRRYGKIQ